MCIAPLAWTAQLQAVSMLMAVNLSSDTQRLFAGQNVRAAHLDADPCSRGNSVWLDVVVRYACHIASLIAHSPGLSSKLGAGAADQGIIVQIPQLNALATKVLVPCTPDDVHRSFLRASLVVHRVKLLCQSATSLSDTAAERYLTVVQELGDSA